MRSFDELIAEAAAEPVAAARLRALGAPGGRGARQPERFRQAASAAGLHPLRVRAERLKVKFYDVGAVVYFLRKVVWTVPGFTVEAYLPRLREVDRVIRNEGLFRSYSRRVLFEAVRAGG
jgi:hypothetical protein